MCLCNYSARVQTLIYIYIYIYIFIFSGYIRFAQSFQHAMVNLRGTWTDSKLCAETSRGDSLGCLAMLALNSDVSHLCLAAKQNRT